MTKQKFISILIILGIIDVIVIAAIYYAFKKSGNNAEQPPGISAGTITIEDSEVEVPEIDNDDPINEVDIESLKQEKDPSVSYVSIYSTILPGKYVENEEVSFDFGQDGSYSGYFNKEHKYVEGYTYEIVSESETENSVILRSPNGTSERKFILGLNSKGSVLLIEDGDDHAILFTLVADGKAYRGEEPADAENSEAEDKPAEEEEKGEEAQEEQKGAEIIDE